MVYGILFIKTASQRNAMTFGRDQLSVQLTRFDRKFATAFYSDIHSAPTITLSPINRWVIGWSVIVIPACGERRYSVHIPLARLAREISSRSPEFLFLGDYVFKLSPLENQRRKKPLRQHGMFNR